MSKVYLAHEGTNTTGNNLGVTLYPQRRKDELGSFQVELTAGSMTRMEWTGRLTPDFTFMAITGKNTLPNNSIGGASSLSATGTNNVLVTEIPMLPEVRTRAIATSGCTFKAYVLE